LSAFLDDDVAAAEMVEPLEQVIDDLKERMRTRHIIRLQHGICSIDAGFVWADLLTNLERAADHCSNIAGCVIDMRLRNNAHTHEMLRERRDGSDAFRQSYRAFAVKYLYSEQAGA
ncbi:MAG: hypothetical protein J1F14_08835, partial [Treponema sp.]|nr:hypothetical protein [Treponema sp.]